MQGKIIKGIAGFYYVHIAGKGVYECKAKGIFRKNKIKPLVGDDVVIDILDEEKREGNIRDILARKNALIRPAVANVDQAMVIFAISRPAPNLSLLDRFLISMERQNVPVVVCFNKSDIAEPKEAARLQEIYENCGCQVLFTSVKEQAGTEQIRELLKDKTTVVAGPSGVGKSSMINFLYPKAEMMVGEISQKIDRGKHTTRHSELFSIGDNTYLMDTPGFSSLYLTDFEKEDLKEYFAEFRKYEPYCRFQGCMHLSEPDCGVKEALEDLRSFVDIGEATITESQTEDKDWINNWKQYFHQFYVDDILIVPSWEEVKAEDKDKMILHIDPGTAFGTGMHETTQLVIRQLKKFVKPGMEILDVGTGSGILGIVALKLGAGHVVGTDLDPCAVPAVSENKEANQIEEKSFDMMIGNIIDDKDVQDQVGYEKYDIVTANILADVLVPLTPVIVAQMKKGAYYITSGILDVKEDVVVQAVKDAGLTLVEVTHQGEWVSVTARKD